MLRLITRAALIMAVAVSDGARAQGIGAPLQLSPYAAPQPTPAAHVKVPANWHVVVGRIDPLSGESSRMAETAPKTTPVINSKTVPTELVMRCGFKSHGLQYARLTVRFGSLTGVGHFKKFETRYRFDEGSIYQFTATSKIGKNHAREFLLNQIQPDPGVEIATAKRLRMEFNFQSAGVTFLDFNVSGATQALNALACPN